MAQPQVNIRGNKGSIIRSKGRQIIYNVISFMEKEAESGLGIPLDKPIDRAIAAIQTSRSTVYRIKNEGKCIDDGLSTSFNTPKKGKRKRIKTIVDEFDQAVIRRTIHNFHFTDNQRPTVKCIHQKLVQDIDFKGGLTSLRVILKEIGFR